MKSAGVKDYKNFAKEISKKVSLQLANTTHALDLTKSACTTVNLIITANTTLDGTYYSKHTIIGSSVFPGLQIISDTTNTSTTFIIDET